MRLANANQLAPYFSQDLLAYAEGGIDSRLAGHIDINQPYFNRLAEDAPATLSWLASLGVEFENQKTIFLTTSGPRLMPAGGGRAAVNALEAALKTSGGTISFNHTGIELLWNAEGSVNGIIALGPDGRRKAIHGKAVVLASGGFEGNPEMMNQHIGVTAGRISTIAPGGVCNRGEGITMAVAAGARTSGQWDMFHGEPTDPRSSRPEAVVMGYPYGILIDLAAQRFIDEGEDVVQETFEAVAYAIWQQKGQIAYLICDNKFRDVPNIERAMLTEKEPYKADSIAQLAHIIGVEEGALAATISEYNSSVGPGIVQYGALDGVSTVGLAPGKSNWAERIEDPPFLAYPIVPSIVFTFGGIQTTKNAEVVDADRRSMPGLFAAGEMTGVYYNKYPGATSFLRSLVFGRAAGQEAARYVHS
jgi:tricarballylate dehydrogenase